MGDLPAGGIDLDQVLHSPPRLKIAMLLAATDTGTFNDLARDAGLTAGNLATHIKVLESAGYLETVHAFVELKPRKRYRLTRAGRDALRAYMRALEATIAQLQQVTDRPARPP